MVSEKPEIAGISTDPLIFKIERTFVAPSFHEGVRELADVQPGMTLEGVVTNVTKFGAFVDIGVHQDGLVHISELSNRYIKDPNAGQIVKVKVLGADLVTKRIALSMKALMVPLGRPLETATKHLTELRAGESRPKSRPLPPRTMDEKLTVLSTRWKVR
jgi:uncharacterized protein